MSSLSFIFLLALRIFSLVSASSNTNRLRGRATQERPQLTCRLLVFRTLYQREDRSEYNEDDLHCLPILNGHETSTEYPFLPNDNTFFQADNADGADDLNNAVVHIDGASIVEGHIELVADAVVSFVEEDDAHRVLAPFQPRIPHEQSIGERRLAVIRVSTNDANVTYDANEIKYNIFDSTEGVVSQYRDLSNHQLIWTNAFANEAFDIMEVHVDTSIDSHTNPHSLREAAIAKMKADDIITHTAEELGDNVIFCLPTIKNLPYVAAGHLPGYMSFFNNEWCLDLTALMHELGHNLGLYHSGTAFYNATTNQFSAGDNHGDYSNPMSATDHTPKLNGPIKGFNPIDQIKLGWHHGHVSSFDPRWSPRKIRLAPFTDLAVAGPHDVHIVSIGTYAFKWNRQDGMNRGTEIFQDQLVATEGYDYQSWTLGGLDVGVELEVPLAGDALEIHRPAGPLKMTVKVCSRETDPYTQREYLTVSFSTSGPACHLDVHMAHLFAPPTDPPSNTPTSHPTDAPSPAPSDPPTSSPTESPNKSPTGSPSKSPTRSPSNSPTNAPTGAPSVSPVESTGGGTVVVALPQCINSSERTARFWFGGVLKHRKCKFLNRGNVAERVQACNWKHRPTWAGAVQGLKVADRCPNECAVAEALDILKRDPTCTHHDYRWAT